MNPVTPGARKLDRCAADDLAGTLLLSLLCAYGNDRPGQGGGGPL